MPTLKEFVAENQIRAEVKRGTDVRPPMMDVTNMNPWTVVLRRGHKQMTMPFFTGLGIRGEPTAEDVLNCLALDANGYENGSGFEDWCADYGYDTDSRKAKATFDMIGRDTTRLRQFLGDELYEELLWRTESL